MKKIVLSVAALFAFAMTNAQETTSETVGFAKGDMFLSGSLGFSSDKDGELKSNSFTVAPRAGYFVSDNIAIGLELGFSGSTFEEFDGFDFYDRKVNTFGIGAFGRYYFSPEGNFSFFGQLGAGYVSSQVKFEGFDNGFGGDTTFEQPKVSGFTVALAPGLSYFVSESFALEATFGVLGYTSVEVENSPDSSDSFELGLDLNNILIGAVYKF